jgi:hypothetical protein
VNSPSLPSFKTSLMGLYFRYLKRYDRRTESQTFSLSLASESGDK